MPCFSMGHTKQVFPIPVTHVLVTICPSSQDSRFSLYDHPITSFQTESTSTAGTFGVSFSFHDMLLVWPFHFPFFLSSFASFCVLFIFLLVSTWAWALLVLWIFSLQSPPSIHVSCSRVWLLTSSHSLLFLTPLSTVQGHEGAEIYLIPRLCVSSSPRECHFCYLRFFVFIETFFNKWWCRQNYRVYQISH